MALKIFRPREPGQLKPLDQHEDIARHRLIVAKAGEAEGDARQAALAASEALAAWRARQAAEALDAVDGGKPTKPSPVIAAEGKRLRAAAEEAEELAGRAAGAVALAGLRLHEAIDEVAAEQIETAKALLRDRLEVAGAAFAAAAAANEGLKALARQIEGACPRLHSLAIDTAFQGPLSHPATVAEQLAARRLALDGAVASTPSDLIPLRFRRSHAPYNSGEIAGLPPDLARDLIRAGTADAIRPEDMARLDLGAEIVRFPDPAQMIEIEFRDPATIGIRTYNRGRQRVPAAVAEAAIARGAARLIEES